VVDLGINKPVNRAAILGFFPNPPPSQFSVKVKSVVSSFEFNSVFFPISQELHQCLSEGEIPGYLILYFFIYSSSQVIVWFLSFKSKLTTKYKKSSLIWL